MTAAGRLACDFTLPASLEAHDPPEARGLPRDGVRMLVSRRASGEISHHGFTELPGLLLPGDLLVVNTTATLPAAVRAPAELAVHFSGPRPDGSWLVELRQVTGKTTVPNGRGYPGQRLSLPGGAVADPGGTGHGPALAGPALGRGGAVPAAGTAARSGTPTCRATGRCRTTRRCSRASRAARRCPAPAARSRRPWSPGWWPRGVLIAPLTLHAGVSSLEGDEEPYPEPYDVPPATAGLVNHVRARGGRVIAAGTTVVRALETAAALGGLPGGRVAAAAGWTSHVVTPETGVRAVDGLLTGLHEPRSSHLRMLAAFAGPDAAGPVLPGRDRRRVPVARVR